MRYQIACSSILFLLLAGCDGPGKSSAAKQNAAVDLRILDWKETQALVASHKGKVVVVDLWSTICAPCLREFPHLVELHRKHGAAGVACISVSCDYLGLKDEPPESLRDEVLAVLGKLKATFENVLLSVPADELFTEIDLASIPAVYVYGPDGQVAARFDNDTGRYGDEGFQYTAHIVPLVEELLAGR